MYYLIEGGLTNMHELSIAGNIVEAVQQEMISRGIDRVATIALRIGRMTDIDAESLRFGFEVITKETPLAETRLVIEHIPIAARCQTCQLEFEVPDLQFRCPACAGSAVDLIHGQELDIAYLEIPDDDPSLVSSDSNASKKATE
ncbi:MAG: hydrogenase maturation nickel metallochaperone HypA [bacterium]|nr:hydrogenase maturation nickel metallochaperone HypA [bacterium]